MTDGRLPDDVLLADERAVTVGLGLDDLVAHNRRSPRSLRWVLAHLVRETARHAGHGDVLREQLLDGAPPA